MYQDLGIRSIPDLSLREALRDFVFGKRAETELERLGYEVLEVKFSKMYEHYKNQKIKREFAHFKLLNTRTKKVVFKRIHIKRGC